MWRVPTDGLKTFRMVFSQEDVIKKAASIKHESLTSTIREMRNAHSKEWTIKINFNYV